MKAYPFIHKHPTTGNTKLEEGMDLRDWFAAKALQNFRDQICSQSDQEWFDLVAEGAYKMADAMMKAREVKNEHS